MLEKINIRRPSFDLLRQAIPEDIIRHPDESGAVPAKIKGK